jgi:NAD(P)-dependent dehydrogenase (short-subunit alcohol dehydrogenase family)
MDYDQMASNARGIVVTGSGGISQATTALLLSRGYRVHVLTRGLAESGLLSDPPSGLSASEADLSDDEQSARGFEQARAVLGELDGLVAVAGGSARGLGDGPIEHVTAQALHANVDLNLVTTTNSLREFVWFGPSDGSPRPRSAVLIGSALARYPASPLFATHGYAALKAGIEGLARSSAAHYAATGLTVNVVAPGVTRTPMAQRAQQDPVVAGYVRQRQPLSADGFIEPGDIAQACEWLLRARSVTGQVIYVDAGWSVYG